VRLCLVATKPTDAVTYGLLPAAARLGLEVFLLTDQPDTHAGALARGRTDQGVQPRIIGCDVHDARTLIGRIAGLPRVDAVFSNSASRGERPPDRRPRRVPDGGAAR